MKKTLVILLTALLLAVCLSAAGEEASPVNRIPAEYTTPVKEGGTVERIEYPAHDWAGNGEEYMKHAYVYLPAGYDPAEKYDLLILCHGIGGNEAEWGLGAKSSRIKNIADHLIENGEVRPLIIVTPNGRAGHTNDIGAFYLFGKELRNDLLPWLDAHYSTWGNDREHRTMAGLSMGGMQTVNIGIGECLDLFGRFGAFSACPTTNAASVTASRLNAKPELAPLLFYCLCGLEDNIAYASALASVKNITSRTSLLNEENFIWQEMHGNHSFAVWNVGFFNLLRLIGN